MQNVIEVKNCIYPQIIYFNGFCQKWSEAFEPRDFFEKRVGFVKYHSHDEILNVNLKVWTVIILQNNQQPIIEYIVCAFLHFCIL